MTEDKELKDQRIPIMMTPSELKSVDDWSFEQRIRSRGEAIRRLVQIGLVFDNHRKQYLEKYSDIYTSSAKVLPSAHLISEQGVDSERERRLLLDYIETYKAVLSMLPLVRLTTGVANNFKADDEIAAIMEEAREILDSDSLKDLDAQISIRPSRIPQK